MQVRWTEFTSVVASFDSEIAAVVIALVLDAPLCYPSPSNNNETEFATDRVLKDRKTDSLCAKWLEDLSAFGHPDIRRQFA